VSLEVVIGCSDLTLLQLLAIASITSISFKKKIIMKHKENDEIKEKMKAADF